MAMIRIERGAETAGPEDNPRYRRHGTWAYTCPQYPLVCGYSRQPLLDACWQLQTHYGVTHERVGLFRGGTDVADISCPIEAGAATMVSDPDKGTIRFVKYIDLAKVFDRVPEHLAERASVGAA
jgi:hypothetical protein